MKQMSGVYPQFAHERDQGHTQKLCPVPSLTLKLLLMPPAADEPWRISWRTSFDLETPGRHRCGN